MKAYIDNKFKNGFFLTEENLIKITDIIKKRLQEKALDIKELKYKVIRNDSMLFETINYNEIIQEENSKRNLIKRIEFLIDNDLIKFELIFDKQEDTYLSITSKEKDYAYLLFSDIKEYLQTEVLKFRGYEFKKLKLDKFIYPLFMILVMVLSFSTMQNRTPKEKLDDLIKSESIQEKLNFLIEYHQSNMDTKKMWYFFFSMIFLTVIALTFFEFLDYVYPRNIFYYGKEIKRYDKHCNTRGKIIWGVIIALIISLVAGFIVYYFTK